jgi:regulator of replication initiation timing
MSYTELEYDFAISSGKPFFSIVISEEGLEAKVKELGTAAIEKDNPNKLKDFREKALSKISTFFTDNKDVKLAVLESLPQIQSEYNLQGWIRYEATQDVQSLVEELANLHKENAKLRSENTDLIKKVIEQNIRPSSAKINDEFDELFDIMSEKKIDITGIKSELGNGNELPDEVNALDLAFSFREMIMRGVTNSIDTGEIASFVFFRLCPYLQTFDLVANEKVPSVRYRRYAITKKGINFFAYVEKKLHKERKEASSENKAAKENSPAKKATKKKVPAKNTANKSSNTDAASNAGS